MVLPVGLFSGKIPGHFVESALGIGLLLSLVTRLLFGDAVYKIHEPIPLDGD